MKQILALIIALAITASVAASDVPSASTVLAKAHAAAAKDKKNVLVVFHASWCGWCRKLDEFLEDKAMRKILDSSLVIVHLDVLESEEKAALENAGGEAILEKLGGKEAGLPFTAITDAKGKLIINSNSKRDSAKTNVGYPAATEEIAHFVSMLRQGAPKITATQRESIAAWFKLHAPKN